MDVWICPFVDGHLQATGRDAKGRKQYRYHTRFREVRESTKYEHLATFAQALPVIRRKVREHMALRGLPREKVLATVVHLLETTLIRVGNDDYAKQNNSYGLTTLKTRHVVVDGNEVRFRFTGKSGKQWSLRVRDRRIANIIRACQELPGQELLQYLDEDGKPQDVTSSDVNTYLKEITNKDITAKDFRTWAGTVLAAMALKEFKCFDSAAQATRNLRAAIENVAARLGNTPTICRKCYVHPDVLTSYLEEISFWRSRRQSRASCEMRFRDFNRKKRRSWLCCRDASLKKSLLSAMSRHELHRYLTASRCRGLGSLTQQEREANGVVPIGWSSTL